MTTILNIDTTSAKAFITLARNGICLQSISNENQKDHAAFLHRAIQEALSNLSITIRDIDAIAVNAGPGSYTGLRVGLASAKGLCYALYKPLITLSALEILATAVTMQTKMNLDLLICPMIDARRMEVYTALYNSKLVQVEAPHAIVLNENSFKHYLDKQPVIFCGDGAEKFINIIAHKNAIRLETISLDQVMSKLSYQLYQLNKFSDLTYSEPYYLKDFHDNR